ncbi:MAG TPA: cytochrome c peroxidase [Acidobacteriaceae bacterium]
MGRSTLSFGLLLGSFAAASWPGFCILWATPQINAGQSASIEQNAGFSPREWAVIKTLSPLPDLPVDTTNRYRDSAAAALLGQKLFFEPRLSGPIQTGSREQGQLGNIGEKYKIACSNCHMPQSKWLFDTRSNNLGRIPNATGLGSSWMTHNVSSLVNTVFYVQRTSGAHWRENDGYSDSEWFDAQSEPEGPPVQNGSRLQLAHVIFERYRAEYDSAFPEWPLDPALSDYHRFPATGSPYTDAANWNRLSEGDKETVNRVLVNYGKAIEAYLGKLVSRNAPFDRFVAGDRNAISYDAKQGLKLFIGKAACIRCHSTPNFSDDDFHVIGLHIDTSLSPHADPKESGRAANQALICDPSVAGGDFNVRGHFSDDSATKRDGDFCSQKVPPGLWRTKSLRHIAETAPYFHDGQAATLEDVINFYDRGGDPAGSFIGGPKEIQPLHLSHKEKDRLTEFLKTLTGEPIPEQYLRDIRNP